jgi:DNA modification methylase
VTVLVLRGDARALPLPDESVDLIVTSPPYFALRSYTDGGEAYGGQIGSEPTPGQYIDNLIACTREWMRVLKPTGSLWVNLGDSYSGKSPGPQGKTGQRADRASADEPYRAAKQGHLRG